MAKRRENHSRRPWEIIRALETLGDVGALLVVPESVAGRVLEYVSLTTAARMFEMSIDYFRNHLEEFPNTIKASGGDIRIAVKDLEAWSDRQRIQKR
jgi:hypothetical protein